MITDQETNIVYFSSILKKEDKYKVFWKELELELIDNNIQYGFIENTKDIWCRDYMPVQVSETNFIQFTFSPNYLMSKKYNNLLTNQSEIELPEIINIQKSNLIIDGGNIVKSKSYVIITDIIFNENPDLTEKSILEELSKKLNVIDVFIIPKLPYDFTGHADGMVRFVNDSKLLVADYSYYSDTWRRKMDKAIKRIEKSGIKIIEFPSQEVAEQNDEGDFTAKGVYINFAQIGNSILLPQFGFVETDNEVIRKIKEVYPNHNIILVNSNTIAEYGGVLNCITWNIESMYYKKWEKLFDLVPEIQTPGNIDNLISKFIVLIHEIGVVMIDFDWMNWNEGKNNLEGRNFDVSESDFIDLCRFMTVFGRAEKFTQGFLDVHIKNGNVLKVIEEIKNRLEIFKKK
ncbi:MAG: agmatine deiminase family protein [Bacteroidales bacterium]|nr:agmatine deiminase family protein [Bacteroidales bacterium]